MKHAMKLALVDPKHLGSIDPKHSEYKELSKNPQGVAQASASINLREILVDPSIPDDIKVKLYSQALDRFLKLGNAIDPDDSKPVVVNHEPVKVQTRDDIQSTSKNKKKKKDKLADSTLSFQTPSPSLSSSTPKTRKSSRSKKQKRLSPDWVAW
jgi:hypothetical protein